MLYHLILQNLSSNMDLSAKAYWSWGKPALFLLFVLASHTVRQTLFTEIFCVHFECSLYSPLLLPMFPISADKYCSPPTMQPAKHVTVKIYMLLCRTIWQQVVHSGRVTLPNLTSKKWNSRSKLLSQLQFIQNACWLRTTMFWLVWVLGWRMHWTLHLIIRRRRCIHLSSHLHCFFIGILSGSWLTGWDIGPRKSSVCVVLSDNTHLMNVGERPSPQGCCQWWSAMELNIRAHPWAYNSVDCQSLLYIC